MAAMGFSSSSSPCGCRTTRILEAKEDVWVEWVRCSAHYVPAVDDPKIVEAAANQRRLVEAVQREEDRRRGRADNCGSL